ncbi:hypothetical protein TanjilG_03629 [Lupinus angustifolius]|uniref:GTD-binding domain-containing protein n=1 Tax=Lupinus angustifolius TaxID=3871 RepID=A0A4P1RW67_LUPAN|nr:hypothetical protein TanjilG_03629 [Lupinus angustifolius]
MCEDCSSSSSHPDYVKLSKSFGFFPWMKQIGLNMIQDGDEGKAIEKVDDEPLRCSCCGVNLDNRFYPSCILIKPYSINIFGYPQKHNLITEGGVDAEIDGGDDHSDHRISHFVLDHHGAEHDTEENWGINIVFEVDQGIKTLADEIYKLDLGLEKGKEVLEDETLNATNDDAVQPCEHNTILDVDCTREMVQEIQHKHLEFFIHVNLEQNYQDARFSRTSEEMPKDDNVEVNMEIRDMELCFDFSLDCHDKSEFIELKTMSLEVRIPTVNNHLSSSSLELHENEEENIPDTPTSVEKDSLDGRVMSDIECGEVTIEKLKSVLKSERKALNTLYAELEDERSTSAIAAIQTMAMINRLQEEKAATQMEALQYQRMMNEQCEYDQEALQLLNEIMVKRDKEKHELEKELEGYIRKVYEYPVREKMIMSRRDRW